MTDLLPRTISLQESASLDPAGETKHRAGVGGPAPRRGYDRLNAGSLAALARINAKTQEALARQAALPGSSTPQG